ncbi:MAG: hypothetical protein DMF24_12450 [Verrucomicrobia bacterium]|nr:MAG: hypothetical protein DMF24_12450 [Verrucomicrobiota bacterium]
MIASQKIGRAAFSLFILIAPFLRAPAFHICLYRTAASALRFNGKNTAQEVPKKASRIFRVESHRTGFFHKKR